MANGDRRSLDIQKLWRCCGHGLFLAGRVFWHRVALPKSGLSISSVGAGRMLWILMISDACYAIDTARALPT
jgi:hypothetical protein